MGFTPTGLADLASFAGYCIEHGRRLKRFFPERRSQSSSEGYSLLRHASSGGPVSIG
jgi:hypothetical protein